MDRDPRCFVFDRFENHAVSRVEMLFNVSTAEIVHRNPLYRFVRDNCLQRELYIDGQPWNTIFSERREIFLDEKLQNLFQRELVEISTRQRYVETRVRSNTKVFRWSMMIAADIRFEVMGVSIRLRGILLIGKYRMHLRANVLS